MINVLRDDLIKNKGKIDLQININELINTLDINKLIQLIVDMFIDFYESSDYKNE